MKSSQAITRAPAASFAQGITTSNLGTPDLDLARTQHAAYEQALRHAGLTVTQLPALDAYPDSVFVEDTAILTSEFALLTRPGADSRRGETAAMQAVLQERFEQRHRLSEPATLDGGDICQAERHFFIGVSARTNPEGARQLAYVLHIWHYTSTVVNITEIPGLLHLKSGLAYLGENTLLLDERLSDHPAFKPYRKLVVPAEEAYAANCLRINQVVLVPQGFPQTLALIQQAGFQTVVVDVSEFRKMDGGLSCLSLRW